MAATNGVGVATSRKSGSGAPAADFRLGDRYTVEDGVIFVTGTQALARLPLDRHRIDVRAGLDVAGYISGYQGSPLGTYDLELGRNRERLREAGIVHQPAVNEELGATAVMGTQLAQGIGKPRHEGVVGYWYGKAPGLDRAGDALRHANMIGTHPLGGAVAFVGDDATAKSSSIPSGSEQALYDLGMPILVPGDVQDILDHGVHAVAMSRLSGLWTGMKIATPVADGSGTAAVSPGRVVPIVPESGGFHHRPHAQLIGAQLLELERSMLDERIELARDYGRRNRLNEVVASHPGDTIGIAAVGRMYPEVRQALRDLGLDEPELERLGLRVMKVGMPHPMDEGLLREFSRGLKQIVVIEEKREFVEARLKDVLYSARERPVVVGKRDEVGRPLFPANGDFNAGLITRVLAARLLDEGEGLPSRARVRMASLERIKEPVPLPLARTPYYCSGCPHNSSSKAPVDGLVGAGIGCSGMVMVMDESQVGDVTGVTQMGGEGAQWIGMAPFVDSPHFFQNLGDGTFLHSGSLAIRASIAAGVDITYKLLYNSAIAMTGGQQPAGGGLSVPEICSLLVAEGVARIIVTADEVSAYRGVKLPDGVEVWDRHRLIEAQEKLAGVAGVTVLIHDQECATELRRKRKRGQAPQREKRVFINERVCEGCGDCGGKSNCLSVVPTETEFGRKTAIHQASCNTDYSCLDGDCPSFLEVIPGRGDRGHALPPALAAAGLPDPPVAASPDFTVRFAGVGGTGVVSVAQILAIAAHLDGLHVRGLDQIGMAQKGGPVISDLRIQKLPQAGSNRLGSADCDVYIGCDLLVAAEGRNLAAVDRDRTVAVLSDSEVPTGHMVADPNLHFPPQRSLAERVLSRARTDVSVCFPAQEEAIALFGVDQTANVMLLGAAHQLGSIPVSSDSLERAIELNGTQVELNLQAFRRGRQRIAHPASYFSVLDSNRRVVVEPAPPTAEELRVVASVGAEPDSELERLLMRRVPDLVAYQDLAYARRYATDVGGVLVAERAVDPGSTDFTEAVARSLYKLMAYKDEAEVARLHLDPQLEADLKAEFGAGARYVWKLHPPLLRALGVERKISLGRWFRPGYRALYGMRRLRGTRLDPFGRSEVRRVERELISEYREAIAGLLGALSASNLGAAVELAELPDMVRGYEEVKLANVERYREQLAAGLMEPG
ncbi:MAG: indolepyruvate ferredoxin oxidoreductase family protein [Actinobacteria bacterium]|nr:indolepyruvate ferredoxin oxidoreductase family protein [Actinomycetota bacterium]